MMTVIVPIVAGMFILLNPRGKTRLSDAIVYRDWPREHLKFQERSGVVLLIRRHDTRG